MRLAVIGIVVLIIAVLLAGNWLYIPVEVSEGEEDFLPIPHYPTDDPADEVFYGPLTYIPSLDMEYMEINYVWTGVSGHTPDTEEVQIYVKDDQVHHVSLRIHHDWMDTYDFTKTDEHVDIYFLEIYHTPYTTHDSLIALILIRAAPLIFLVALGVTLIVLDFYVYYKKKAKKT